MRRSANNLKQIGLACHNYHDVYKTFPAAVQIGPQGIPHSWRVSILPFLEQENLYNQYKQDEPWDSPHNKALLAAIPDLYRAPGTPSDGTTSYFGFSVDEQLEKERANRGLLPPLAGTHATRIPDIIDGTAACIMVVESKLDVPWTQPTDIPFDPNQPLPAMGGIHTGGFWAAICDGRVTFFPETFDRGMLLKVLQRGDGSAAKLPELHR
jgi:hypothetical protein